MLDPVELHALLTFIGLTGFTRWSYNFTCVSFWNEAKGQLMLKSDRAQFLWKIHFCQNLGKKGAKIGYFAIFF